MLAKSTTPGPLKILIVDATKNINGFEHEVSRRITAELVQRGIPVTDNSPAFAEDELHFAGAFSSAGSFSVALLVAHGAEDSLGANASQLGGPGGVDDWFSTAALTEQMQDKLVLLCVCHGYCQDAIDAFVRDSSLALSLIAPSSKLLASEAVEFFPMFLAALMPTSTIAIDPIVLREKLDQTNRYSGYKMKLFSDGLPS